MDCKTTKKVRLETANAIFNYLHINILPPPYTILQKFFDFSKKKNNFAKTF